MRILPTVLILVYLAETEILYIEKGATSKLKDKITSIAKVRDQCPTNAVFPTPAPT
jgi:hypothetical protein